MNFQTFVETIKDKISSLLSDDLSIQIHTTLKNNNNERMGITISDKEVNLSPTIYLEEFYTCFQKGDSIDDIVERLIEIYQEVKFEHSWQVHTISDFELMREKIVYKIIHAPQNETLLESLPHVLFLDFAIVFYILYDIDENGTATIPISHDLLHLWNTSLPEIHQIAKENTTRLLPASFKPMRVVINELLGNLTDNEFQADDCMFVLTNSIRSFGATCIIYEDLLMHLGDFLKENFYILPSSIHEVIIIPESQSPDKEALNSMVIEVNETPVELEDVLSDHVYYYNCHTNTLTL